MLKQIIIYLLACFLMIGCDPKEKEAIDLLDKKIGMCAPEITDANWYLKDVKAPIFEGLDVLNFPITTNDSLVQRYFNQGLVLSYGFNHAEAARSFYYASKLDPECAMAHLGFAYVLGPNYNAGMEMDNYERAYEAIQKAVALSDNCTPKEQAIIKAMARRYSPEALDDRSNLDRAYADAMRHVHESYPGDADIATLYAESLMNLHPWDLWDKEGKMKDWTPEILKILRRAIVILPNHVGAHHFFIHAVEASDNPGMGLESAELFDSGVVPGAGHLLHMPSHIYIRTGDYHKGTMSNRNAIIADSTYVTACHAQGAYPLAYYPHNYHFMAGTATLEGNRKWAVLAAEKVSGHANKQIMKEPGWGTLQHYYTIPYYVFVKFGMWQEILKIENFDNTLKYPEAVRHYARGMAFLGIKDLASAKLELAQLEVFANDKSLEEITVWDINSVSSLIQIAEKVLSAEILASEYAYDESIDLLREAVIIEDNLNYDEPPDWFFSVRHNLGAVQIEAGRYGDAIITYEQDLKRLPKNGWAMHGLLLAYEKMGNKKNAANTNIALKEIWSTADIKLKSSRLK